MKNFKQKGGIVKLDEQSSELISQLAGLDAERDAAKIDLMTSNGILQQYKIQLKDQRSAACMNTWKARLRRHI